MKSSPSTLIVDLCARISQQPLDRSYGNWDLRISSNIFKAFAVFLLSTLLVSPSGAQVQEQNKGLNTEFTCKIIVMPKRFANIKPTEAELEYFGQELAAANIIASSGQEVKAGINGDRLNLDLVRTLEGPSFSTFSLNLEKKPEVDSVDLGFHGSVTLYAGHPFIFLTGIAKNGESKWILLRSQPVK
jgi:hypothetical protein